MRGKQNKAASGAPPPGWWVLGTPQLPACNPTPNPRPLCDLPVLGQVPREGRVLMMQSKFPADETQPWKGRILIRKQFKLTTSACASPKRRKHSRLGRGPPRDHPRRPSRGCGAGEPHPGDVASVAAQQCLAPARNSGPCAGEAACCSSDTASTPSCNTMRQQEVPRSQTTLCWRLKGSEEPPGAPRPFSVLLSKM